MTIDTHNNLLSIGMPQPQYDATPRGGLNHSEVARIKRYYDLNGCPSMEQVDEQNKRVLKNCRK